MQVLLAQSFGDALEPLVLVPLLFTLVGLLFAGIGVRTVVGSRRFRRVAQPAPGVVTDLRYRPGRGDSSGSYHPVLRFTTADGRQVDTESMYGRSPARARAGDRVTVLYDPADPTRAVLGDTVGGGCLGTAFVLFGLSFTVLGLAVGGVLAYVVGRS